MTFSTFSGWATIALIVLAAAIPLGARFRAGKRPPPDAPTTKTHVAVGSVVILICFAHTGLALPRVGAPGAPGEGMIAMLPACLAFLVLIAHVGLGLQLRKPKLKDRIKKRRAHFMTASIIFVAACIHIGAIWVAPK